MTVTRKLIRTMTVTIQQRKKPLRKGRKLIKSEFVVDLQDNSNDIYYFLRAHVHHSMKNEYPLNASVALSKASGFVVKASCDCRSRALNRCTHIAAVLLTLINYTKANGHRVTMSSTSQPCVLTPSHSTKPNINPES